jgi:hypothetical protein
VSTQPLGVRTPLSFLPRLRIEDPLAAHWLREVTLRLRREICWLWRERGLLAGLALPAGGALPPYIDRLAATLDLARYDEEKRAFFAEDATAGFLSRLIATPPPDVRLLDHASRGGFAWVVHELELGAAECFLLALALSPVVDSAALSVFAACQNDPARPHPTLALAQRLWDAPEDVLALYEPAHVLSRYGLLPGGTDWDAALNVPSAVARQLLFPSAALPAGLSALPAAAAAIDPRDLELTVARLRMQEFPGTRIVPVLGRAGAPLSAAAGQLAAALALEGVQPVEGTRPTDLAAHCTLAWLRGAVLYAPFTLLAAERREPDSVLAAPLPALPITLVLGLDERSDGKRLPGAHTLPALWLRSNDYQARLECWRSELGAALHHNEELQAAVADCARRFRYEAPVITRLARALLGLKRALQPDDLYGACRADIDLGELAQVIAPRFRLADLMLPAKQTRQLSELIQGVQALTRVHYEWGTAHAWNESGLSALFAGAPGTGKTMAAEIIAAETGMPLHRIDLSQVVNKYIGETEKNLRRLFDAADAADVILFFDEADALFGKRTEVRDAHDRYANLEVSYLLERMERFKGLAILASNRKKDLDEAFMRRLRFLIDFPMPGAAERLRIWRSVIPAAVDASALDFEFLAERFTLAGGHIRAIVFQACLQSARSAASRRLDMPTVLHALKRELDKLGRTISLEQFGPFASALEP